MADPEKVHVSDDIPEEIISGLETLAFTLIKYGVKSVRIEIDHWSSKAVIVQEQPNGGKTTEVELFTKPLISKTDTKTTAE